jgi:hypothetical protein
MIHCMQYKLTSVIEYSHLQIDKQRLAQLAVVYQCHVIRHKTRSIKCYVPTSHIWWTSHQILISCYCCMMFQQAQAESTAAQSMCTQSHNTAQVLGFSILRSTATSDPVQYAAACRTKVTATRSKPVQWYMCAWNLAASVQQSIALSA